MCGAERTAIADVGRSPTVGETYMSGNVHLYITQKDRWSIQNTRKTQELFSHEMV